MSKYASPQSRTAWHSDPENCSRVSEPERHVERDDEYIEYHGLEPCRYCHPDFEDPRADPADASPDTLANRLQYGSD